MRDGAAYSLAHRYGCNCRILDRAHFDRSNGDVREAIVVVISGGKLGKSREAKVGGVRRGIGVESGSSIQVALACNDSESVG